MVVRSPKVSDERHRWADKENAFATSSIEEEPIIADADDEFTELSLEIVLLTQSHLATAVTTSTVRIGLKLVA